MTKFDCDVLHFVVFLVHRLLTEEADLGMNEDELRLREENLMYQGQIIARFD